MPHLQQEIPSHLTILAEKLVMQEEMANCRECDTLLILYSRHLLARKETIPLIFTAGSECVSFS